MGEKLAFEPMLVGDWRAGGEKVTGFRSSWEVKPSKDDRKKIIKVRKYQREIDWLRSYYLGVVVSPYCIEILHKKDVDENKGRFLEFRRYYCNIKEFAFKPRGICRNIVASARATVEAIPRYFAYDEPVKKEIMRAIRYYLQSRDAKILDTQILYAQPALEHALKAISRVEKFGVSQRGRMFERLKQFNSLKNWPNEIETIETEDRTNGRCLPVEFYRNIVGHEDFISSDDELLEKSSKALMETWEWTEAIIDTLLVEIDRYFRFVKTKRN